MNTRCPPKRVPSATRFFTLCRLTLQPPQSYSIGGQRSFGQLTGKPAGAWPYYRGRWCAEYDNGYSTAYHDQGYDSYDNNYSDQGVPFLTTPLCESIAFCTLHAEDTTQATRRPPPSTLKRPPSLKSSNVHCRPLPRAGLRMGRSFRRCQEGTANRRHGTPPG
ncbi:UNVERIFIED_CONTAM: hypothetical protein FKN15_076757 [Acipenser sinensis]